MASAPGIDYLPIDEQRLFVNEFDKDLEFIQLVILMISKACATGSVDITWVEPNDGLRQVIGTTQAAKAPCSRYLQWDRQDPSQRFCNIVSDHGQRAAESCGVCENAAEKRVGRSGRAQVYRCHAGLTDIAVPVMAAGRHVATLYSGQVLTTKPSRKGFNEVAGNVDRLKYINLNELEEAYYQVPLVSEKDIENTVHILETFAEFLGRLWTRLGETVKNERSKMRSSQLAAKQFAYMVLQPESEDRGRICQLMKELGFVQPPNRVLVVSLGEEDEFDASSESFDIAFTSALQAVEEVAERSKQTAVAYLRRQGVCVFFRDIADSLSAGLRARPLAEKILYEISQRSSIRARAGIGGVKSGWQQLAESYHEACLALTRSEEPIVTCSEPLPALSELTSHAESACQQLAAQRIEEARFTLRALLLVANQCLGSGALVDQRNFFSSTLESLCFTALKAGCDSESVGRTRAEMQSDLAKTATVFEVQATFLEGCQALTAEMKRLMTGKHEKIIARVQQLIDRSLKQQAHAQTVGLTEAAATVGVSTGHLSRVFRRMTGLTFRDYSMSRRVEHARRLLLDPLNNVSAVSEACGFATPAYFARVFRKFVGCTPTDYAKDPQRQTAQARLERPSKYALATAASASA